MASLSPPVARTLLVAKIELSVEYLGETTDLSANQFVGGVISGNGFLHLESFAVRGGVPVWRYAVADALIEQRIFMAPGANTSYLRLEVLRASAPLRVTLKPLLAYRDYHSQNRGARPFQVQAEPQGCRIQAYAGARAYRLSVSSGAFTPDAAWYWNFWHEAEAERGLDAIEDLLMPGSFVADLAPAEPLTLMATAESGTPKPGDKILEAIEATMQRLVAPLPTAAPHWIRTLAQSSDQFVVQRGADFESASVIAGYPWFADWGRDTMISLPGIATTLERYDLAANLLRSYASFANGGMLPNRFPDGGEAPEYNTADATLWFFHALDHYLRAKPDPDLTRALFPTLMDMIAAHVKGTRYGIKVDSSDGLLHAGVSGSQVTWMDAKNGDRVFTARIGKPVEINALWLNALDVAARLAAEVDAVDEERFCRSLLSRATSNFGRFWNESGKCLYDVLDTEGTEGGTVHTGAVHTGAVHTGAVHTGAVHTDASIRPNQIFAVSLPFCALPPSQMRSVVDCCARELLTSHGLRSLSSADRGYIGHYVGDGFQRDSAYHMGTVWAWLLGPFARAHFRVYGDARLAQSFLSPMAQQLESACLGSLSEIFDGDAPHTARGCFAQAWSVAEILRAWMDLEKHA